MIPTEPATDWLIRAREGNLTAEERQQLADWLADSPAHVREYLQTGELWVVMQSQDLRPSESKEHLLAVLRTTENTNVVEMGIHNRSLSRSTIARARKLIRLAAAACLVVVTAYGGFYAAMYRNVYTTGRGEQRSIVLSDGSVVQLNTLSTLVVHISGRERRLELKQGEAYFRVTQDMSRPFEVSTPNARVRALGTAFDIYNRPDGTRVSVLEGKVAVDSLIGSAARSVPNDHETDVPLEAGEQITVSHAAALRATPAKAQSAIVWMQRRIVLDNDTLASAVAEFNRYNTLQLRIDSAELASLKINGVFNADDPRALVKFLREVQGVNAKEASGEIVLVSN